MRGFVLNRPWCPFFQTFFLNWGTFSASTMSQILPVNWSITWIKTLLFIVISQKLASHFYLIFHILYWKKISYSPFQNNPYYLMVFFSAFTDKSLHLFNCSVYCNCSISVTTLANAHACTNLCVFYHTSLSFFRWMHNYKRSGSCRRVMCLYNSKGIFFSHILDSFSSDCWHPVCIPFASPDRELLLPSH